MITIKVVPLEDFATYNHGQHDNISIQHRIEALDLLILTPLLLQLWLGKAVSLWTKQEVIICSGIVSWQGEECLTVLLEYIYLFLCWPQSIPKHLFACGNTTDVVLC